MKLKGIVNVNNLTFSYGKNNVFTNFSLIANEGDFISVVGANKSGKTTLIKLLASIIPSNDKITVNYLTINARNQIEIVESIGVVLGESSNQFLFENVYDELVFPLENLSYSKDEIEQRVGEVSRLLKINDLLDKTIANLTNSEKAKVLFAIAIMHSPKILLLDNPFMMMSKNDRLLMVATLKYLVEKKSMTVVLTSNDLNDSLYSDYLYILNNGKIAVEGNPISVMKEDKLINRLNLELPFMVDLSNKLILYNLLDSIVIDMDRMVNKLWK